MSKRTLTDEEKRLWLEVNRDTKRTHPVEKKVSLEAPTPSQPTIEIKAPARAVKSEKGGEPPLGTTIHRKVKRKIQSNRLPIEGRLDLHGYTQDEAHQALQHFLSQAYQRGHKLVLVITGKGSMKKEDRPRGILKEKVPHWLQNRALFPHVLSIDTANPKDGGSGALYVFLRKSAPT